jgi:hypothetical protein
VRYIPEPKVPLSKQSFALAESKILSKVDVHGGVLHRGSTSAVGQPNGVSKTKNARVGADRGDWVRSTANGEGNEKHSDVINGKRSLSAL